MNCNIKLSTLMLIIMISLSNSTPQCENLVNHDYVFNIRPEETQYINLNQFFRGYNLDFQVRDDEQLLNTINFVQPPVTQQEKVENIIENGELISYDAWQNEDGTVNHVILARDEDDIYTVKHGPSGAMNVLPIFEKVENFEIYSEPTVVYTCYQIFFVKPKIAVVDCLVDNTSAQEKFSQYFIINLEPQVPLVYPQRVENYFPNLPVPTRRINIVFEDESLGYFIISTIPFESNESGSVVTKSEINIYHFKVKENSGFPDGELFSQAVIDTLPGETDPLYIVDMAVSEQEIYVLSTEKLFRFQFDGQNIIELTRTDNQYSDDQGYITNLAVYQDIEELFVMLAEDNQVTIYFWPPDDEDTDMELSAIVNLRNLEDIQEIQFGEDYAFLVSDGDVVAFNWYEAIQSAESNTEQIATISVIHVNYEEEMGIFFESFSKDYVFIASEQKYGIYFFSDPTLLITNPASVQEREEFDIVATSRENGQELSCILRTYIQPIFDDKGDQIFSTGRKMSFSYIPGAMGVNQRVDMDGEYEGPNIQYTVGNDNTHNSTVFLSNYTMVTLKPATIDITEKTESIRFMKMWTMPNRRDAFYVFTQSDTLSFKPDRCIRRDSPERITCLKRLYSSITLQDTIDDFAVDLIGSRMVLAVTYKSVKFNMVDFFYLNGTVYSSIKYNTEDLDHQITDIEMLNGYVFVMQSQLKNIDVYELDLKMKSGPVFKLNDDLVGQWPCFGDLENDWTHLAIFGHQTSPNMFYIETYRCLVEVEIIGSRPHFVASYELGAQRGPKTDRSIAVTERSIIVATVTQNDDQTTDQSIYEIFNDDPLSPIQLKPVQMYGFKLTFPIVSAYNYFSNNFYFIAIGPGKNAGPALLSIKSEKPDISRINLVYNISLSNKDSKPTQMLLQCAGFDDDYLVVIEPQTSNFISLLNPTNNQLIYFLENEKISLKFFTGIQYLKVGITGGINSSSQQSRILDLVIQNPQTTVDANYTEINRVLSKGIVTSSLDNAYIIDDQSWFDGTVLTCEVSQKTNNYKNFAIRNHIEMLKNSNVNSYAGALDLLSVGSNILILIDNGTLVQLNSNLTQTKTFQLGDNILGERYPYKMVPMSKDQDSILIILKNLNKKLNDYAAVIVKGVSQGSFEVGSSLITFNGQFQEIFQIYVYNATYVFIGWGAVPRYDDELGFVSIYTLSTDKTNNTYMDFILDINGATFTKPTMSISGFHFEDGLFGNTAQSIFVIDDRGDWFNYAIMNISNAQSRIITPVPTDFKQMLRSNQLYYNQETTMVGLRKVDGTQVDAESLNVTFQFTTSNTAIYEIRYIFWYKQNPFKPNTQPNTVYNNYGPNYKLRKPALMLGQYLLVDYISVKQMKNKTDFLAIYDRKEPGKILASGAKLLQLKGGIVKGSNPFNIDIFTMVPSPVDYRPNIVFQDTSVTPDSNDQLINTLFAATYHENITLLSYSSQFPVQNVTIAFKSFYTANDLVTIPFVASPPDSQSSNPKPPVDPKKDNLEVLWILLGTFGGLLLLAAAYILIKRQILLKREQIEESAENDENYEKLN